jgi:hypothetical protein
VNAWRQYQTDDLAEPFNRERAAGGDGYDVMSAVEAVGWKAVAGWGSDGWDMLDWPYYVAYVRNERGFAANVMHYQLVTWCEGDVTAWQFPTQDARRECLDALFVLLHISRGATFIPQLDAVDAEAVRNGDLSSVPDHCRGPYGSHRETAASDEPAAAGPTQT